MKLKMYSLLWPGHIPHESRLGLYLSVIIFIWCSSSSYTSVYTQPSWRDNSCCTCWKQRQMRVKYTIALAKKCPLRNSRCWILTYCMHCKACTYAMHAVTKCSTHVAHLNCFVARQKSFRHMCRATSKHSIQFATPQMRIELQLTSRNSNTLQRRQPTQNKVSRKESLRALARQSLATQPSGSALAA